MNAPEVITIKVCPVCGRTDRFTPFTGGMHRYRDARCEGQPQDVVYVLAEIAEEE